VLFFSILLVAAVQANIYAVELAWRKGGGGMANFGRQIAKLVSKEDHEGIA